MIRISGRDAVSIAEKIFRRKKGGELSVLGHGRMTYGEICRRLEECKIENASGEARILIEEMCGEFSPFSDYSSDKLSSAVEKRCTGYPLQYIIGKWWFCRCEFEVNENCLIPRPDTEITVEAAQKLMPKNARFADLCTGSGCIAISLLDLCPDSSAIAVELYPETLEIAKRNAGKNKVAERFCGVLGDVLAGEGLGDEIFDVIVSNPPYIRSDVVPTLSVEVSFEPSAALDGGEDGMIFYRKIVEAYQKNLAIDGSFVFEIGYDQAEDIKNIAEQNNLDCRIIKDFGGNDRVAVLRRKA